MVQFSHISGGSRRKKRFVFGRSISRFTSKICFDNLKNTFFRKALNPGEWTGRKFTCFPRFPLEIRQLIWRYSFEGRTVSLHVRSESFGFPNDTTLPIPFSLDKVYAKMPITLWINQESRTETLVHYKDLIQNPALFRDPVYFHPDIDTMALESYYWDFDDYKRKFRWRNMRVRLHQKLSVDLLELAARAPSVLDLVQSLYISGVIGEGDDWDSPGPSYELPFYPGIVQFHALREVIMAGQDLYYQGTFLGNFGGRFEDAFQEEKKRMPLRRIPRLRIFPVEKMMRDMDSNDYLQIFGEGRFEDDVKGGAWTHWFIEPESYTNAHVKEDSSHHEIKEEYGSKDNKEGDEAESKENEGEMHEEYDGITVVSRFNLTRWSLLEDEPDNTYSWGCCG
ncbi:hypothetical protein DSL72_006768 [Monilinia vaccinii-corymbosi]|uniref:2EXR domain-containing protein n=1 Tax=Monilinia vaccinii-corymbosi TaxID=61207 RepID=A0A8A3PPR5_9HELO|nr:hypothetical protein DSL72_006768 [Monilinia vaccinii-corymbosi]